ncbi:hypothetical protein KR009_005700 [Drosophila setifemur]|nr:hypothetical protein KR009_005700 [Drosophila setifemur]
MEQILNKENTGVNLPNNPPKNGVPMSGSTLKQTVKKCVLGKLDNVMYQTPKITPFKNNIVQLEGTITKLLVRKAFNQNVVHKDREVNLDCYLNVRSQSLNLFDYMDFPTSNCVGICCKPISETWSDAQYGYDALLQQIEYNFCTLAKRYENVAPPVESHYDSIPHLKDHENIEATECEYLFNLLTPLPNFDHVDILF